MKYPEYAKVNGKEYKINTDFRVAIKCMQIADDDSIGVYERPLGIIATLFEEQALEDGKKNPEIFEKLLDIAKKYLMCGKEESKTEQKQDMDFIQDEEVIRSSFLYDYKYDPYEMDYVHWYKYFNEIVNFSDSEMGNCCALNRLRNFRNINPNEIKDANLRNKVIEGQEQVAIKKNIKPKKFTTKEQQNMEEFRKLMGL